MSIEVQRDEGRSRYVIISDGVEVGHERFRRLGDGVVDFVHTEVSPEHRGAGLAGTLIERAVDDVVASGGRVRASCPAVAKWFDGHPERSGDRQ